MIYKGSSGLKAYVGSTGVDKMYKGDVLVYTSGESEHTYESVTYIENTSTAYIDTGFTPNQDTRVVIDVIIDGYNKSVSASGNFSGIFGTGDRSNSNAFILFFNTTSKREQPQYKGSYTNTGTFTYGTKYTIDFNKNVFSGVGNTTFTYSSFTCPNTLTLFRINNRSFKLPLMKVYSCQVYDNGTLVRDYVPKLEDGTKYGLWDNVEGIFYTSPNNVAFSGG